MMKEISMRKVLKELRGLGFRPARTGNGTGHAVWKRQDGQAVRPVLRHGDGVPIAYLYAIGLELERSGVTTRREFTERVLRG